MLNILHTTFNKSTRSVTANFTLRVDKEKNCRGVAFLTYIRSSSTYDFQFVISTNQNEVTLSKKDDSLKSLEAFNHSDATVNSVLIDEGLRLDLDCLKDDLTNILNSNLVEVYIV